MEENKYNSIQFADEAEYETLKAGFQERIRKQKKERECQKLFALAAKESRPRELWQLRYWADSYEYQAKLREAMGPERGPLGHIFDHIGVCLLGIGWAWFIVRVPALLGHPIRTVSYVLIWLPFIALMRTPPPQHGRAPIQASHVVLMFLTCAGISLYLWLSGY